METHTSDSVAAYLVIRLSRTDYSRYVPLRDDSSVRASNIVAPASTKVKVSITLTGDTKSTPISSVADISFPTAPVTDSVLVHFRAQFVQEPVAALASRVGILPGHFQCGCFPRDCCVCRQILISLETLARMRFSCVSWWALYLRGRYSVSFFASGV